MFNTTCLDRLLSWDVCTLGPEKRDHWGSFLLQPQWESCKQQSLSHNHIIVHASLCCHSCSVAMVMCVAVRCHSHSAVMVMCVTVLWFPNTTSVNQYLYFNVYSASLYSCVKILKHCVCTCKCTYVLSLCHMLLSFTEKFFLPLQTLTSMCWLGNGKSFASSYSDGCVALWNPAKPGNKPEKTIFPHGI